MDWENDKGNTIWILKKEILTKLPEAVLRDAISLTDSVQKRSVIDRVLCFQESKIGLNAI